MKTLFKIAVIGSHLAGKTTTAKMLGEYSGAPVISGDAILANVIKKNQPAYNKVLTLFGGLVLDKNRNIDPYGIKVLLRDSPEKRQALNHILFHALYFEVLKQFACLEEKGCRYVIYDAPLLYEGKMNKLADYFVLAQIDRDTQVNRIAQRYDISREEADIIAHNCYSTDDLAVYLPHYTFDTTKNYIDAQIELNKIWGDARKTNGDGLIQMEDLVC